MHFTTSFIATVAAAGFANADFYFGAAIGETQVGTIGQPMLEKTKHEYIIIGNADICDARNYSGDPGPEDLDTQTGDEPWINWCGDVKLYDADLNLDGPCGSDVKSGDGSDKLEGKHYATITDNKDGGKEVGECYFEFSDIHYCSVGLGSEPRTYSIRCETDKLGDPKD